MELSPSTQSWTWLESRGHGDERQNHFPSKGKLESGARSAIETHGAPIAEKKKWDPDFAKRKKMKKLLDGQLKDFSIHLGGTTSLDVTKLGIDKAYGIRKLRDVLGVPIEEMIFVGDAVFPGGNDYPTKEAGVVSIQVGGPNETKRVIEAIIACMGSNGNPSGRKGVR